MTTLELALRTFAVAFIAMVTGAGPQENVMMPPAATAATTAAEVQLAGVPLPTTRVGWEVSTAFASAGTVAWPFGLPGAGSGGAALLGGADGLGGALGDGLADGTVAGDAPAACQLVVPPGDAQPATVAQIRTPAASTAGPAVSRPVSRPAVDRPAVNRTGRL
jgi:hypothetical protein